MNEILNGIKVSTLFHQILKFKFKDVVRSLPLFLFFSACVDVFSTLKVFNIVKGRNVGSEDSLLSSILHL